VFQLAADTSPALVAFLSHAEPVVCRALAANTRSRAFDGFTVRWDDDARLDTALTHSLTHAAAAQTMQCTGVAWNSTGSVVAVAYGRVDHDTWCAHKSLLCTVLTRSRWSAQFAHCFLFIFWQWNLDRTINSYRADSVMELPVGRGRGRVFLFCFCVVQQTNRVHVVKSCVTSVAFHPTKPSDLACGTFNGLCAIFCRRRRRSCLML
jgi:hypothetical protein